MTLPALAAKRPLWARLQEDVDPALPLWKAALIALGIALLVPLLIFGVNWSFLPVESPPTPVMSVRLEEPPQEFPPPPPPPENKPKKPKKIQKPKQAIPLELPKPLPDEAPSRIVLPKPEPEPKLEKKKEEKPPEPEPEPEPEEPEPLPSVFRDVKPVRKVRPIYPPEAEAQHIQGRVKVRLTVDAAGKVTDVEMLLAEPPGVFEEAVLAAVRQYQFKRDGTTYEADQEIVFKIDD